MRKEFDICDYCHIGDEGAHKHIAVKVCALCDRRLCEGQHCAGYAEDYEVAILLPLDYDQNTRTICRPCVDGLRRHHEQVAAVRDEAVRRLISQYKELLT
jgi:hypothetical protein